MGQRRGWKFSKWAEWTGFYTSEFELQVASMQTCEMRKLIKNNSQISCTDNREILNIYLTHKNPNYTTQCDKY